MDAVELGTTHKHGVELALSPAARARSGSVRGLAGEDRRARHDLRVSRRRPGRRPQDIDETREWVKLAKDLGSPSVKVRPNGLLKGVPKRDARADRQGAAGMRRGGARPRRQIQLEVHGSETSRLPASARSSILRATIPACVCAGTRTRPICSTAASSRRSTWSRAKSARSTCATCGLRRIPSAS